MKTIKVVKLSGCHWCQSVINELVSLKIPFTEIEADSNGKLADQLEALLNTTYYPITIIEADNLTTYVFRATEATEVGYKTLDTTSQKIGCLTLAAILTQIKNTYYAE